MSQKKMSLNMNTSKLNILVIDDEKNHRRSAEMLLKGHNLLVVGSYDEAAGFLTSKIDYGFANILQKDKGLSYAEAIEKATTRPNFDVVLTDLMMPASRSAQGPEGLAFVGKQMPVGTFLILLALAAGVKNIGMVTDMNHHNHPASAALDPIGGSVITVGETKIFATNNARLKSFDEVTGEHLSYEFLNSEEGKEKYPEMEKYGSRKGVFSGKGWDTILETLLAGKSEE